MRILLDAAPVANRSGTGYYVQKLVEFLARMETDHEFVALVPPLGAGETDRPDWPGGGRITLVRVAPESPWRQVLWRQWRLASLAKQYAVHLVHYPAFIGCLRSGVPSVVTIPDLVWREHAESVPPRRRGYYTLMIPASMRRARRLIAISRATADKIAAAYPQHAGKTRVVPLGVDRRVFAPVGDAARLADARGRYGLPERFVLGLGTLEPRKNLAALVEAFARVAGETPGLGLVLAGKEGFRSELLLERARASGVADRIVLPGHIATPDLPAVYTLAAAFAFPSLEEGFGLPILEAMACGVPVVTGDRSAMAEVAGDAAELVDPANVDAIAASLRRVLHDPDRAQELVRKGLARTAAFPWTTTAARTVAVYEEALAA